jgi:hypothetical protein
MTDFTCPNIENQIIRSCGKQIMALGKKPGEKLNGRFPLYHKSLTYGEANATYREINMNDWVLVNVQRAQPTYLLSAL